MEIPFLEIPNELSGFPTPGDDEAARDIFDISYLRGLSQSSANQSSAEKHIVFTSGDKTFGVPLRDVTEVCRSLPITSLPDVPGWLTGLTNLRGNLLAVIDPDAAAGDSETGAAPAKSRIIVLADRQKHLIGLLVDQIKEIALLSPAAIVPSAPGGPGLAAFAPGRSEYRDSFLMVIDTGELFSWPELKTLSEQ